jgi:hypothetical protein
MASADLQTVAVDRDFVKSQRALIGKARANGDELELAAGLHELGMYFDRHGMHPLAISFLSECREVYKRAQPEDGKTLQSIASLASAHTKMGNLSEAEKLYGEWLSAKGRQLGCWDSGHLDRGNPNHDQALPPPPLPLLPFVCTIA